MEIGEVESLAACLGVALEDGDGFAREQVIACLTVLRTEESGRIGQAIQRSTSHTEIVRVMVSDVAGKVFKA